jgi:spermidine synthase
VHEVVARATTPRGEVVVRRRDDDALELRVNGVFVMDTAESSSERLLARAVLDQEHVCPRRVLVGGLGLGFTLRELLDDARVERVLVAEVEPAVVEWVRSGLLPGADLLTDPRVEVVVDDVRRTVGRQPPSSYDVLLLDVDNGPDFLVHDDNARVYEAAFLAECRDRLDQGGVLAVWSSSHSQTLADAMTATYGSCQVIAVDVDLQGRAERYWLFTSKMVQ